MSGPNSPSGPKIPTTGSVFSAGSQLDGGRYTLDRELGQGGFGTVYLAREERPLKRPVVIKLPHVSLLAQPGFVERFQAEIGHLASLEHSSIVKIYGAGVEDGLPYAVVQYLPGGDLSARLHSGTGTMPPHRIIEWLPGVASALDHMHRQGVLHRDVKPDNILFDAQDQAYLSDFGISKAITDSGDENQIRTQTGMFVGAPAYVAPEYVDRKFTPACDQYSLAVVLYEALSGRRPHEAETAERLIIRKATEPPAPLLDNAVGLSPALAAVVMRGVSTRPGDRFDSCSELAQAFAAAITGISAAPNIRDATAPGIPVHPEAARTLISEPVPRATTRRLPIVLGIALLASLAFAGWLWSNSLSRPGPAESATSAAVARPESVTEETAPIAKATPAKASKAAVPIEPEPELEPEPVVEAVGEAESEAVELRSIPLAPRGATLVVRSNVSGDRVFIDGEEVGSTGAMRHAAPMGRPIAVRVEKPGYESFEQVVTLQAGDALQIRASLKAIVLGGMRRVGGGRALYGCNAAADRSCYPDEMAATVKRLSAFHIDRTEVTVADYARCANAGACSSKAIGAEFFGGYTRKARANACNWNQSGRQSHPINCVNWSEANSYCKWRGKRLPSESEWEKAARGKDGRKYPWGNVEYASAGPVANIADRSARRVQPGWLVAEDYDDQHSGTAPVDSFPAGASPSGAVDMIGNVWEWTSDFHDEQRTARVARGGSYSDPPRGARVSERARIAPTTRLASGGFRCAK